MDAARKTNIIMTLFEAIKKELVSLGWDPEHGDGDHFLFRKDGQRPITVSMSVSDNGRAYSNLIANIRKQEPAFSLGKQPSHLAKNLSKQQKRQQNENARQGPPLEQFSFIRIGEMVRYTSPEKKSFIMLSRPNAVMNIQYVVVEIRSRDGKTSRNVLDADDTVRISTMDGSHSAEVHPSDLDAWKLFRCTHCEHSFPVNLADGWPHQQNPDICAKCSGVLSRAFSSALTKFLKAASKDGRFLDDEGNVSMKRIVGLLPDDLAEKLRPYRDTPLEQLPRMLGLDMIDCLGTLDCASEAGEDPKDAEYVLHNEENGGLWPVWGDYMRKVLADFDAECSVRPKKTSDTKKRGELQKLSYRIEKHEKYNEMVITATTEFSAWYLMATSFCEHPDFSEEDKTYLTRVVYEKGDLDMYLPYCTDEVMSLIDPLKEELGNELFQARCHLIRSINNACDNDELNAAVSSILDGMGIPHNGGQLVQPPVKTGFFTVPTVILNDVFPQSRFTECEVQTRITMFFCGQENHGLYERVKRDAAQILSRIKDETSCELLHLIVTDNPVHSGLLLSDDIIRERSAAPITTSYASVAGTGTFKTPIQTDVLQKLISRCRRDGSILDEVLSGLINKAVLEYLGTEEQDKDNDDKPTDNDMKEETILDPLEKTNADAADKTLADKTTRQLLAELKARGVTFDNLSVPVTVRRTLSMDEI